MFPSNNKYYLCILDYHSKFPIVKKAEGMFAESLKLAWKVRFSEYGLLTGIMSDTGGNFISDKLRQFYKFMNIEEATSSSYHHQSNGQVEVCEMYHGKCIEINDDIHIALLQIRAPPLEPLMPSHAMLLFIVKYEALCWW